MALDRIVLVRHDVSGPNRKGYIQGQTDTPLQPGYKTRVDRLTDMIAEEEAFTNPQKSPVYILCSELGRTYETGERIHRRLLDEHHVKSELRLTELLKERGEGDLEGKSFEEARPHLSSDPNLSLDAETIYGLLYLSNNIPNGERHESVTARLGQFVRDDIQQLEGVGIIAAHLISGMNYLKNLLTDGNILGDPPRDYQHFPNLSVVRLSFDPQRYMRYTETGQYGPPNSNGITGLIKYLIPH